MAKVGLFWLTFELSVAVKQIVGTGLSGEGTPKRPRSTSATESGASRSGYTLKVSIHRGRSDHRVPGPPDRDPMNGNRNNR